MLPDFPRTTAWLTEGERQLAIWRLEEDVGGDDCVKREWKTFGHGLKLAAYDIKTWIMACNPISQFKPPKPPLINIRWQCSFVSLLLVQLPTSFPRLSRLLATAPLSRSSLPLRHTYATQIRNRALHFPEPAD